MRFIAAILLMTLISVPALAKAPRAALEGYGEAETLTVTGKDLPLFYVVLAFFESGTSLFTEWGGFYDEHLIQLGVEPGSDAASVVSDAMLAAGPLLRAHTPADRKLADSDPAAFEAAQIEELRKLADQLATIYAEMMAGLEGVGFDPATIEAYLDDNTRSQSALYLVGESKRQFEKSHASVGGWLGVDNFEQKAADRMNIVRHKNQ